MMKRTIKYIFLLFILINAALVTATEEKEEKITTNWNSASAYLLTKGRIEVGVFQPLRYGFSEKIELSAHPLTFFIMPNLSLKWGLGSLKNTVLAIRNSFYYPTFLLRTIAKKGIGGIISPEFNIPHMVSLSNEVLLTYSLAHHYYITGKAGFCIAVKADKLDKRTTIDLPLVFPRLSVYYHDYLLRTGIDLQGKVIWRWNFLLDTDLFFIPKSKQIFAFEHKGMLLWTKSKRFQFSIGYKLVFGEYPFGTQWHLLPLFDCQWAW